MTAPEVITSMRRDVDQSIGKAAALLEAAADDMADLKDAGYEYHVTEDTLAYVRALSRYVLDLHVGVRKENHEGGGS